MAYVRHHLLYQHKPQLSPREVPEKPAVLMGVGLLQAYLFKYATHLLLPVLFAGPPAS